MEFKLGKIAENKLLFTNRPFRWVSQFAAEKGVTVITPTTRVEELLKLKANSELYESFINIGDGFVRLLNVSEIEKTVSLINERFRLPYVEFDRSGEKTVKSLFEINDELLVTREFLESYFIFLDSAIAKKQTIVVAGFDNLVFGDFKMLTIHLLLTTLSSRIHWGNLQQLVMLDFEDLGEIVDGDRFKSWLELKARTVLTIDDVNAYFRGDPTMNSFLIEKALRQLK